MIHTTSNKHHFYHHLEVKHTSLFKSSRNVPLFFQVMKEVFCKNKRIKSSKPLQRSDK